MHFSIDRTVHTTAFDKPVVDHWLERKIAQTSAGSTEKDRSDDRPLQRRARYRLCYIPLPSALRSVRADGLVCLSKCSKELSERERERETGRGREREREREREILSMYVVPSFC